MDHGLLIASPAATPPLSGRRVLVSVGRAVVPDQAPLDGVEEVLWLVHDPVMAEQVGGVQAGSGEGRRDGDRVHAGGDGRLHAGR